MRIEKNQIKNLKNTTLALDVNAKIFLFGSRVNDTKKGGDIDLLILSDVLKKESVRKIKRSFFNLFGEQRLDIVLDTLNPKQVFTKMIFPKAVKL